MDAALREQPDLALLDVNMPGSGLAAAWEITARLPATRVVMLTISRDDWHVFAALRAGAAGYLLKDTETERLPDALRDVMAGEAALPVTLVTRLVEEFRDRAPRRRALMPSREGEPRLTSREWEVLELMRRKMTTAQIARTLGRLARDRALARGRHPAQAPRARPRRGSEAVGSAVEGGHSTVASDAKASW